MLAKTAFAAWLLGAALLASGECQGDACIAGADEAGLLQVRSPHAAADLELPEVAAPEHVEALSLFAEMGDPARARDWMPRNVRRSMDALGGTARRGSRGRRTKECNFRHPSDCPMRSLVKSAFTSIMPAPDQWGTHCINDSSKYMFQVYPGRSDRLLIYYQDGGACWDPLSASMPYAGTKGICKQEIVEQDEVGVFDKTDKSNPFRDFTIVHVNYCSGDAFTGNSVMPWGRVAGYNNSRAAVAWALHNTRARLDKIAVVGASAGALAAQVWTRTLLHQFSAGRRSYRSATAVVDSYLGIFPAHTQPHILGQVFKTCSTPLGRGWAKRCGEDLTVQDVVMETMGMFRDVPFLFINSKADFVQGLFYGAVAFTLKKQMALMNPDQMYTAASDVLEFYSAAPNFAAFQVDGKKHIFLPEPRCKRGLREHCQGDMYSAGPAGPLSGKAGSGQLLVDWLRNGLDHRRLLSWCRGVPVPFLRGILLPMGACLKDLVGKELVLG
uniref:Pectin acetylesterase n=1 Tax=Alexandrium monilatum TaxID=311494 RepID=A0A7S4VXD7_9DINO|mmetsp:Transcript_74736/g.230885  ORF Transcript_74736/g.230885 Transcript_74736/m.230885 type:complete len:498 (-) Transcript_74736:138-1631(-)